MEFAIAASCLDGFTFNDMLYACTSLQVQGLELSNKAGAHQGTWSPELDTERVLARVRGADLRVTAIAAWNDFVQADGTAMAAQIEYVRRSVDLAIECRCEVVRVLPGHPKHDVPQAEWGPNIIAGLKEVLPYAEDRGVLLALQTHGRVLTDADQALAIIEGAESYNAKLTLDPAHFRAHGHDVEATRAAISRLIPYTAHVHLTDGQVGLGARYQPMPVGEGDAPVELVVSSLLSSAFARPLCFRYDGPLDPVEGLRRGIAYLRDLPKRVLAEAGLQ